MDPSTEIFQLKDYDFSAIVSCLEKNEAWKTFILHIPTCIVCYRLGQPTTNMFNDCYIELFEREANIYNEGKQPPSENLLHQWALYGSAVPTVSDLCSILKTAGLKNQHEIVKRLIKGMVKDYKDTNVNIYKEMDPSLIDQSAYHHTCTKLVSSQIENRNDSLTVKNGEDVTATLNAGTSNTSGDNIMSSSLPKIEF